MMSLEDWLLAKLLVIWVSVPRAGLILRVEGMLAARLSGLVVAIYGGIGLLGGGTAGWKGTLLPYGEVREAPRETWMGGLWQALIASLSGVMSAIGGVGVVDGVELSTSGLIL